MLTQLPNDILRLIVEEIPSSRGFYSLTLTSRIVSRLAKEVQEKAKRKYLMTHRTETTLNPATNSLTYTIRSHLPNDELHGSIETYQLPDHLLLSRESYKDGIREGPTYKFELASPRFYGRATQIVPYRRDIRDGIYHLRSYDGNVQMWGIYDQNQLVFCEQWISPNRYVLIKDVKFSFRYPWVSYCSYEAYENNVLKYRSHYNNYLGNFLDEVYENDSQNGMGPVILGWIVVIIGFWLFNR